MTKHELHKISQEIRQISRKLQVLDSNNPIEYQQRDSFFNRWDFLDHKVAMALKEAKRCQLRIVA